MSEIPKFCRHETEDYSYCDRCYDLIHAGSYPMTGFNHPGWFHDLKTLPEFFEAMNRGLKKFEIRKNDRCFRVGDVLRLKEWDGEKFTGRITNQQVTYITDFEQKPGFVVLGIGIWLCFRQRP